MTLMSVMASCGDVKRAKFLIDNAKADINIADNNGRTPLMLAIKYRHREMIDFLIAQGCHLDVKDKV